MSHPGIRQRSNRKELPLGPATAEMSSRSMVQRNPTSWSHGKKETTLPSFTVLRPDGVKVDITDNIKNALGEDDVREAVVGAFKKPVPGSSNAAIRREKKLKEARAK